MKKIIIIGGGAMGSAFTIPCLDNNNKVTITEPYSKRFIKDLSSKKKFHTALKIKLPLSLGILAFKSKRVEKALYPILLVMQTMPHGILDWGDHEARTLEDMGYPNWVVEKGLCPGLPDWTALKNPDCAKNFTTPDSPDGKGRMLEGPQTWHGDLIPQRVDALGLGNLWWVKFAGSADALWAELAAAKKEGRGTIIFNWTPNFTDGAGFTFIDFPPYTAGCRPEDGGDGKCGSPDGYLKKAVNGDFPKTHPAAAAAFKKMSFSTSQIGAMAALVDTDKMTHEDAAKKWLADNKSVWQAFTK